MSETRTYTINEAAALTGRHPNTIRQKIRLGQLAATVQQGKFGEEYRIPHAALVQGGLLPANGGPGEPETQSAAGPVPEPREAAVTGPQAPAPDLGELTVAPASASAEGERGAAPPEGQLLGSTVAALSELYQRHENAMYRLGYLQGELERVKALAETAESLREDRDHREEEVHLLRAEAERRAGEAESLRRELDDARARLQELDALRRDLSELRSLAEEQEARLRAEAEARKPPAWQFWRR